MLPPPNFPDLIHVANGCYVSSFVYLARFRAAYPAERAETVAIVLPNADGSFKPHTVAIVSWHGKWWARDEFYGLADLRSPSSRPWDLATVTSRVDAVCRDRYARQSAAGHRRQPDRAPAEAAEAIRWRVEHILTARQLLPVPSEIVWLRSGDQTLPLLFFRTSEGGGFAVYDPSIGTAQAVGEVRDVGRMVAAVAERMGYPAPSTVTETAAIPAALRGQSGPAVADARPRSQMEGPAALATRGS